MDFRHVYWRFFSLLGEYWALFKAISSGKVGRGSPTSDLYKIGLLKAKKGYSK
jgi:hypothetical protein